MKSTPTDIISFKYTVLAFAAALVCNVTHSFEVSTHEYLTRSAIQRSVIIKDVTLFTRLGFPPFGSALYFPNLKLPNSNAQDAVTTLSMGAVWEDDRYDKVAYNHFFDPQFNNRQGRGLDTLIVHGIPSPDWALSDKTPYPIDLNNPRSWVSAENPYQTNSQGFSYRDANVAFYKALTDPVPNARQNQTGLALQSLGHVTHHIQDMAQPQHVRNDPHLHRLTIPIFGGSFLDNGLPSGAARFELDTEKLNQADIDQLMTSAELSVPARVLVQPPKLLTARQYFHGPITGVNYLGMADFTAHNFVTQATGLHPLL